ncbi:MAG: carboxypeptidase-like regulatory domain-containing protein, partial [Acidobacteria bacterium]|nr:carboxypeptidase-like regulatory domain-containing protein [Acidobacteriota bacterium]
MRRRGVQGAFACMLAALFLVWAAVPVSGQVSRATILGQVKDASGAVISGAKVEVLALNTGQKRETQTGSDGTFTVADLPAGPYRVTVTQSGFGGQAKELTLLVGQAADLIFELSPAAREEVVKVQAETPLIET